MKSNGDAPDMRIWWALLIAAVIVIYLPSLDHLPRGDQRCILADTTGKTGILDNIEMLISYNRTRTVAPGDSLLFRPLVFLQLGIQRLLFEDRFILWQMTGIALHLLVLWRLNALLLLWVPDRIALGLTALFGLAALNVETVTWNHINAYMTFQIFALTGWRHVELIVRSDQPTLGRLRLAAGHLMLAAFSYEFGAVLACILALRVALMTASTSRGGNWNWRTEAARHIPRIRACLPLLVVPVAYAAISGVDYAIRSPYIHPPFEGYGNDAEPMLLPLWLSMAMAWRFWLAILFTPQEFAYSCVSRIIVWGIETETASALPGPWTLATLLGYVIFAAVGASIRPPRSTVPCAMAAPFPQNAWRARWSDAMTPLAVLLAYTLLIAAGRLGQRGVTELTFNLSWGYAFLAFAIILFAVLPAAATNLSKRSEWAERRTQALAAVGLFLVIVNVPATWSLNKQFVENQNATRELLNAVGDWRRIHERAPGFSFRFRSKPVADIWDEPLPPGYFMANGVRLDLNSYIEIIHGDVIRPDPIWWLTWDERPDGSGILRAVRAETQPGNSHGRSPDTSLVSTSL